MKQKQTRIKNEAAVTSLAAIKNCSAQTTSVDFVQRLHTTTGNQGVGRWVQAKLKVSAPGDAYEQEADRVANLAMGMSSPVPAQENGIIGQRPNLLQRNCSECGPAEPQLKRQESGAGSEVASSIVASALNSEGQPLDSTARSFMEPRFGHNFSGVRVHTGREAAHSASALDAIAYASDQHIVFNQGQYEPHTDSGRRLIAHELTHVVQQGGGSRSNQGMPPGRSTSLVQRTPQAQTTGPATPVTIQNTSRDRSRWLARADAAVRDLFKISGSGLTDSNVSFLNEQQFAAQFTGQGLEDRLFSLFIDMGYNPSILPNGTPFGEILDYNHITYGTVGYSDPETSLSGSTVLAELREFIRKGISKGYFVGRAHGEFDLATRKFPDPYKITPQELITRYITGITNIAGPRSRRSVSIQAFKEPGRELRPDISTLVHEACHFYISDNFRDMAQGRKDGNSVIGNERISEVLIEGFAEHFAREVVRKNERIFGPSQSDAYSAATKEAELLIAFVGEANGRAAYFGGDRRHIASISHLVDDWKKFGGDSPPVDVISGADPRAETPKLPRPHRNP
jgi:hypothetical protein